MSSFEQIDKNFINHFNRLFELKADEKKEKLKAEKIKLMNEIAEEAKYEQNVIEFNKTKDILSEKLRPYAPQFTFFLNLENSESMKLQIIGNMESKHNYSFKTKLHFYVFQLVSTLPEFC